ncbi:MAG: hypothetical protein RLZZ08_1741, partial [Pseudomonadota bacterium]
LVDPEANIIWGSAFNPDLDGKIRVSVVATGIEQSAEQAYSASQPLNLGASRGPKKPALPVPTEAERAQDAVTPGFGSLADEQPAVSDFSAPSMAPAAEAEPAEAEPAFAATDTAQAAAPYGEPAAAAETVSDFDGLDLTEEAAAEPQQDELLLNASRLAEDDAPVQGGRRRQILGEGADQPAADPAPAAPARPASSGGSTLFERMANLSRGSAAADDGDDDDADGGSSLRIPRFLGRQNNQ